MGSTIRPCVAVADRLIKGVFLLCTSSTESQSCGNKWRPSLTFRHRASCTLGQAFRYSPEKAFIYLINKYISLSDICLTVHH